MIVSLLKDTPVLLGSFLNSNLGKIKGPSTISQRALISLQCLIKIKTDFLQIESYANVSANRLPAQSNISSWFSLLTPLDAPPEPGTGFMLFVAAS